MRNFENNYDSRTDRGNTGWESMGSDDLERRRAERASRRYEEMRKSEKARTSMVNKAKALAMAAVLVITVASGVAASGCSTHEIMDTDRAEKVETLNVDSVTLIDGPNIRRDPMIPNKEDGSTVIMDFGEEGQVAQIPYQGKVYYYHNQYSSNGGWYGFPAEQFADELFEDAFIDQKEAERLVEKDSDGVIWINDGYVRVDKKS